MDKYENCPIGRNGISIVVPITSKDNGEEYGDILVCFSTCIWADGAQHWNRIV